MTTKRTPPPPPPPGRAVDSNVSLNTDSVLSTELLDLKSESHCTNTPATLNIYELDIDHNGLRNSNLGLFVAGVEVFGIEWSYGGHHHPISGIFSFSKPGDVQSISKRLKFRLVKTIFMGNTRDSLNRIISKLTEMGYSEWTGARYHVVYKNSVHFASAFLDYLCSQNVPTKYNCMGVIKYKYGYLIELLPKEFNTPRELAKLIQSKISFAKQFREELSRTKFKTMLKEGKAIVETMRSNQDTSDPEDRELFANLAPGQMDLYSAPSSVLLSRQIRQISSTNIKAP